MQNAVVPKPIPLAKTLAVLIGFPVTATLISLLLLHRQLIAASEADFFNRFWLIIIGWYLVQILLISKLLKSTGWTWANIGFSFSIKQRIYFIGGYLIFAVGLLVFIEMALANAVIDSDKLQSISSLTPKTTMARIIFILMALVAGIAEEIVYRGFAINALIGNKFNKWLAVIVAAIPFIFQHGLKSLDQFTWFLSWGLIFGLLFVLVKKLYILIIIHWLVILSAMLAVLQVIKVET